MVGKISMVLIPTIIKEIMRDHVRYGGAISMMLIIINAAIKHPNPIKCN